MSLRRESEFVRLKQLLREANKQAEQERKRIEKANQRVKQERIRIEDERRRVDEADQRTEDKQRNRIQEESKTRPTTFEEYLRACYIFLSKPLRTQTYKSLSTQGSITSPKNKPYPTLLKPWTEFLVLQQQLFEKIYEYILRDVELFSSVQYLTKLGQDIYDRLLASKKDLEAYQRLAIKRLTTNIISYL